MPEVREMNLGEWIDTLPLVHSARNEYAALLARCERAEARERVLESGLEKFYEFTRLLYDFAGDARCWSQSGTFNISERAGQLRESVLDSLAASEKGENHVS